MRDKAMSTWNLPPGVSTNDENINPRDYVGTCPACGDPVRWDDPDGPVWTCPADLSERNVYREPANPKITEELREAAGVFSNCGEDYGFLCYERMPLHSRCYDKGNY